MAVVTKVVLKTYFQDGKEPDENKYVDLIDTMAIGNPDHGDLTGLSDDDHPQYLLANGSRIVSGNLRTSGGLSLGDTTPPFEKRGTLFLDNTGSGGYGFISSTTPLFMSSGSYYDGSVWRQLGTSTSSTFYVSNTTGLYFRTDQTSRSPGAVNTHVNVFGISMAGNTFIAGGLQVGGITPVTTSGRIKATEIMLSGGLTIGRNSSVPDDDMIVFYQGTTKVGEIGSDNTAWLKLNPSTNKPIYSPRYMRIDGGISVTASVSDPGDGKLAAQQVNIYEGGTLVGDLTAADTTWLRINQTTGKKVWIPNDLYIGGHFSVGTSSLQGADGDILYTGNLRPRRASTLTGYIFIPLITPVRIQSGAKSTGSGSINLTPTALPTYVKAIAIRMYALDTNSGDSGSQYYSMGGSSGSPYAVVVRCHKAGSDFENSGIVPATGGSNSYVYWKIQAGAAGSMTVVADVYGYYI